MPGRLFLKLLCALSLSWACTSSYAEDGLLQAKAFDNLYTNVCLKNINNLAALKEQLKSAPPMPEQETRKLLRGAKGTAWVVPEESGGFILAVHDSRRVCTVLAHHANAKAVEQAFLGLVNKPIPPLEAKKISAKVDKTSKNGDAKTTTYEWQAPKAKRKLVFVLSTTTLATAEIQAYGSISIVDDGG